MQVTSVILRSTSPYGITGVRALSVTEPGIAIWAKDAGIRPMESPDVTSSTICSTLSR